MSQKQYEALVSPDVRKTLPKKLVSTLRVEFSDCSENLINVWENPCYNMAEDR
jgi:hypothetical protein